jgi:hypothetical protein
LPLAVQANERANGAAGPLRTNMDRYPCHVPPYLG